MEGRFGFGIVDDEVYQDRELLDYVIVYGDAIQNTRLMLRRQEKEYVEKYGKVLDPHLLVPYSHIRRAALIKQVKHRDGDGQPQEPEEEPVHLRRAQDLDGIPQFLPA